MHHLETLSIHIIPGILTCIHLERGRGKESWIDRHTDLDMLLLNGIHSRCYSWIWKGIHCCFTWIKKKSEVWRFKKKSSNKYFSLPRGLFLKNALSQGWASLMAQMVKNPPAMWETWVQSLVWEDPLEKGNATHSSIVAWRIPWSV